MLKIAFQKKIKESASSLKISRMDVLLGSFRKFRRTIFKKFSVLSMPLLQSGNTGAFSRAAILIWLRLLEIKYVKIIKHRLKIYSKLTKPTAE